MIVAVVAVKESATRLPSTVELSANTSLAVRVPDLTSNEPRVVPATPILPTEISPLATNQPLEPETAMISPIVPLPFKVSVLEPAI